MDPTAQDRTRRRVTGATVIGGAAIVTFWLLYFLANDWLGLIDPSVALFEEAFVLADTVLAGLLFGTAVSLKRRNPSGPFLLAIAASMTVYLGMLDATFYGRNGLFYPLGVEAVFELVVISMCIGGGAYGLSVAWRLWRAA